MATTETDKPSDGVKRIPPRRDVTYQFPVYRWLSWLSIAGYAIGLGCMYLIAGMFGIPAPLGWAFLVILFCMGIALLERPRQLLNFMMFYFLLMPSNRLFGLLPLPLPGFLDELFFIPFIAVIAMNLVQDRVPKGGNWFPCLFGVIAAMSWYVNGKQGLPLTIKILLVNFKFFIVWYFCRLTLTFKDTKELFRWCWLFIGFAAVQFAYNTLWQGAPWPRIHPDLSAGVFGPDSKCAHNVGYISVVALFLLVGWGAIQWRHLSARRKWFVFFTAAVILYDLVFMTDTKHVLVLMPLACAWWLFLPGIPARFRAWAGMLIVLVVVAGGFYFQTQYMTSYMRGVRSFGTTPKGQLFRAVTTDFHYLVRYPLLGAGPGRFASNEAREARTPLARRYITPYYDEAQRLEYFGRRGSTVISSVLGSVNTDFFFIVSEFGWLGEIVYFGFWLSCAFFLWAKGIAARRVNSETWGVYLALSATLVLFMMLQFVTSVCTIGCLAFPVWMLVGRAWDMPLSQNSSIGAETFPESENAVSDNGRRQGLPVAEAL